MSGTGSAASCAKPSRRTVSWIPAVPASDRIRPRLAVALRSAAMRCAARCAPPLALPTNDPIARRMLRLDLPRPLPPPPPVPPLSPPAFANLKKFVRALWKRFGAGGSPPSRPSGLSPSGPPPSGAPGGAGGTVPPPPTQSGIRGLRLLPPPKGLDVPMLAAPLGRFCWLQRRPQQRVFARLLPFLSQGTQARFRTRFCHEAMSGGDPETHAVGRHGLQDVDVSALQGGMGFHDRRGSGHRRWTRVEVRHVERLAAEALEELDDFCKIDGLEVGDSALHRHVATQEPLKQTHHLWYHGR